MSETELLERITVAPQIFGGKPIIRGHRLAVEHAIGMSAAGSTEEEPPAGYSSEPGGLSAILDIRAGSLRFFYLVAP